jgi:D-glycero-D-manno-heptose 1,7-bisphosphate phosphatase
MAVAVVSEIATDTSGAQGRNFIMDLSSQSRPELTNGRKHQSGHTFAYPRTAPLQAYRENPRGIARFSSLTASHAPDPRGGSRYHSGVSAEHATASWNNVRTVFLDRDGVLNEKAPEGQYVARWEDFQVIDGVIAALALLNRAGLRTIVVTNQRGVALGRYTAAQVEALHARFQQLLAANGARVDGIYVCPHDYGECNCRKPLPGLFEQAATDFPAVSAAHSVMIGDSLVDMEFGKRLGMRTILIEDKQEDLGSEEKTARAMADLRCASLSEAVSAILDAQ